MNYDKMYIEFKAAIPESITFCEQKEKENFIDETVGMHISFGMVIVPYILYIVEHQEEHCVGKVF